MVTNFDIVSYALKSNNNGLVLVRRLLKDTLDNMDEIPVYKQASNASCAANLLSHAQPKHQKRLFTSVTEAFHVTGGNIDLFIHRVRRLKLFF